jgi:hypothetical protein
MQTGKKKKINNHLFFHFLLAKFRDLMYGVKCGAVIGYKSHDPEIYIEVIPKREFRSQSQSRTFIRTSNHGILPDDVWNHSSLRSLRSRTWEAAVTHKS